jgi:hypothetical protein
MTHKDTHGAACTCHSCAPMAATLYAVRWTERNGRTAEFHYARGDVARGVAAQLRRGWRSDARVERVA